MYQTQMDHDSRSVRTALVSQLKERFENEGLPIPDVVGQPDYFERAYRQGLDEDDP
jgi:hypothetical protein